MNILLLLIPLSIVLVGASAWAFLWAVNHKQFEDLDAAALNIIEPTTSNTETNQSEGVKS